ncbi:MAG TPA: hypothetical protein VMV59_06055, partial [Candidatus Dormibacteraeota bacterium]|nr:hypothetical protein [Candidatus Dormibacteraeota bacterium]
MYSIGNHLHRGGLRYIGSARRRAGEGFEAPFTGKIEERFPGERNGVAGKSEFTPAAGFDETDLQNPGAGTAKAGH